MKNLPRRINRRPRLAALVAATAGLVILAAGCAGPVPEGWAPQGAGSSGPGPGGSHRAGSSPANGVTPAPAGSTRVGSYGLVNPAQETSTTTASRSGVTGGALFGGTTSLAAESGKLGRKLAIVRDYYVIGEHFPRVADRNLMAQGITLLVSLDTLPGGPTYASIAAGKQDATISVFLRAVNEAAVQYHLGAIYFCFEHEVNNPGTHHGLGTPTQFIQAWDHLHQIAVSEHLDWNDGGRIHWVLILTYVGYKPVDERSSWARDLGSPTAYWPGDNEVDIAAADGYNSDGCKHTGDGAVPDEIFDSVISFAHANGGLPVFIAEWGSTPRDPGGGQARFIDQMSSFVAANPAVAGVMYWDNMGERCTFRINNYPSAIAAMAAMGRSPALQGHVI